jgi:hypothetical protein
MPREITTTDGTRWTCAQAYAGLEDTAPGAGTPAPKDPVKVVCTPDGGAQTVRLSLPGNWHEAVSDDELAKAIEAGHNA